MLRRIFNLTVFLLAALLIMAAVALSAARLLLPLMGDFRGQLEAQLEERLQRPVTIGGMDAAWRGFGPTLQLRDVRILDDAGQQALFAVGEVWLHLDLLESVRGGSLAVSGASLVGMDVDVLRDADGRIALRGFGPARKMLDPAALAALLQHNGRLNVVDAVLHWEDRTGRYPSLTLPDVDIHLENRGRRYRADLIAGLPAAYGERLVLSVSGEGDPARPGQWKGRGYAQVEGARLGAWSSLVPDRSLDLWGQLDLKLWGRFHDGGLDELALDFALQDAQITGIAGVTSPPFAAQRIDSRMLWERGERGWRLTARDFGMQRDGEVWPAGGWRLERTDTEDQRVRWRGEADYLDIGMLSALLSSVMPAKDGPLHEVQALSPGGQFSGLRFDGRWHDGVVESARFRSHFQQLAVNARNALPGLRGWNGLVDGDLEAGRLQLDTAAGVVELPKLFRESLPVREGGGEIRWRSLPARLRLESDSFRLDNADVAVQGHWRLDLPRGGHGPDSTPYLDLLFDITRGKVASTGRYLPAHIMNPHTVEWLDRGLVAGDITGGAVVFHGPVRGFPYPDGNGFFEVRARVRDGTLDYREGWEPVEDLEARLRFTGAGMEILGTSARIGSTRLREVRAFTPDLRRSGPALRITGIAEGEAQDMLRFLNASPIGGRYGRLSEQFRIGGDARLDLNLTVPLRALHGDFAVQGELSLRDNSLRAEEYGLSLEQLSGRLSFTESTIGSQDLTGRLWDTPLQIRLDTRARAGGKYHRVRLNGPLGLVKKVHEWQWPVAPYLQGAAPWEAEIRIHEPAETRGPRVEVELGSDLRGIEVALPNPFHKAKDMPRRLSLHRRFLDGRGGPLEVRYGDDVRALLDLAATPSGSQRMVRGELHFGGAAAELPEGEIFRLRGELARVSLADWQAVLPGSGDGDAVLPPMELDLAVGELEVYQRLLRDVGLHIRKAGTAWDWTFTGPAAQGQLLLTQDARGIAAVKLDLDHLRVETMPDGNGLHEDLKLDPASLPALAIRTRHLQYDDRVLGNLELDTQRMEQGMRVERFHLKSADYDFTASGRWDRVPGSGDTSRFTLDLQDGNLAVLQRLFDQEVVLDTREANATLVANWPGSPLEFNLDRVEGNLELNFGSGKLLKVNAPAGKALSILSIHTLQRRLSLDFSDLFGKGFSFDHITGHVTFVEGNAYTSDLTILGPAAQIDISGRTGFVDQDYDQLVTVTPLVSSNIPLAGALAGGPAVGAALFVAEKLFGDRVNRLARYQYQVTGAWRDPKLERISVGPIPLPGKSEQKESSGGAPR